MTHPHRVILTAAHVGFKGLNRPLGGGDAVANRLAHEWSRDGRWPLTVLAAGAIPPASGVEFHQIGPAGSDPDLTRLSELEYAAFCERFGAGLTEALLAAEPGTIAVTNDLAEGPDFARLGEAGVRLVTLFHVDVVDYFCRIYLHGLIAPERLTRAYDIICRRGWERRVPLILRLVFGKQRDAMRHSSALVVPSIKMKQLLTRCYPQTPPSRIHVIPWGCWSDAAEPSAVAIARDRFAPLIHPCRPTLLTLSRISPEKGHDLLLRALQVRERRRAAPVSLIVAGEAAFMQGARFLAKLKRMAARIRQSDVHFVGYADPAAKQALFSLADLYVHPSRHESYGLTLCEAIVAGLPVISSDHYSASDLIPPITGWITPRGSVSALANAIDEASALWRPFPRPRIPLPSPPIPRPFSEAARDLADLLDGLSANADSIADLRR